MPYTWNGTSGYSNFPQTTGDFISYSEHYHVSTIVDAYGTHNWFSYTTDSHELVVDDSGNASSTRLGSTYYNYTYAETSLSGTLIVVTGIGTSTESSTSSTSSSTAYSATSGTLNYGTTSTSNNTGSGFPGTTTASTTAISSYGTLHSDGYPLTSSSTVTSTTWSAGITGGATFTIGSISSVAVSDNHSNVPILGSFYQCATPFEAIWYQTTTSSDTTQLFAFTDFYTSTSSLFVPITTDYTTIQNTWVYSSNFTAVTGTQGMTGSTSSYHTITAASSASTITVKQSTTNGILPCGTTTIIIGYNTNYGTALQITTSYDATNPPLFFTYTTQFTVGYNNAAGTLTETGSYDYISELESTLSTYIQYNQESTREVTSINGFTSFLTTVYYNVTSTTCSNISVVALPGVSGQTQLITSESGSSSGVGVGTDGFSPYTNFTTEEFGTTYTYSFDNNLLTSNTATPYYSMLSPTDLGGVSAFASLVRTLADGVVETTVSFDYAQTRGVDYVVGGNFTSIYYPFAMSPNIYSDGIAVTFPETRSTSMLSGTQTIGYTYNWNTGGLILSLTAATLYPSSNSTTSYTLTHVNPPPTSTTTAGYTSGTVTIGVSGNLDSSNKFYCGLNETNNRFGGFGYDLTTPQTITLGKNIYNITSYVLDSDGSSLGSGTYSTILTTSTTSELSLSCISVIRNIPVVIAVSNTRQGTLPVIYADNAWDQGYMASTSTVYRP